MNKERGPIGSIRSYRQSFEKILGRLGGLISGTKGYFGTSGSSPGDEITPPGGIPDLFNDEGQAIVRARIRAIQRYGELLAITNPQEKRRITYRGYQRLINEIK